MTNHYPKKSIAKRVALRKAQQTDTHQYGKETGNIRWSETGNELLVEGFSYELMKDQVRIILDGPGYSSTVWIPRVLAAKLNI